MKYNRSLDELRDKASLHWTKELNQAASKETLLFDLLETHDEFIAVLKVSSKTPLSWKIVLAESKSLTLPLFVKHLMILSDLGGETLNKILPIKEYFPENSINLVWNEAPYVYTFETIGSSNSITNTSLKLTVSTIKSNNLESLLTDLAMILLFGSQATNGHLPSEYQLRTIAGTMLGDSDALDEFLQKNYIRVSTQIKGAHSNALGHFAQSYVARLLTNNLPADWDVNLEGSLTGVQHIQDVGSETNFDIVAISPNKIQFGIEVSFQVTTNSVIERKARDSSALQERVKANGHHICYVIDGAGNINIRRKAVETICTHSDCTVALTDAEIIILSEYLKENG